MEERAYRRLNSLKGQLIVNETSACCGHGCSDPKVPCPSANCKCPKCSKSNTSKCPHTGNTDGACTRNNSNVSKCPFSGATSGTCTRNSQAQPVRVLITGAAGNIAYSLLFMIAQGNMLGNRPIILHLLDIAPMAQALKGVEMELQDCAFPLLKGIVATTDLKTAFMHVDIAFLVGAFPRQKGMERKDLLKKNAAIFQEHGKALNDFANRDVKVLVVGNPANTNCLIASRSAPDLPKSNFTAMTRLDHNRALAQISLKSQSPVDQVKNVIIWGNHSATQYPDVSHAHIDSYIKGPQGSVSSNVKSIVNDNTWLEKDFIASVQQRGAKIIEARKLSSAASAAHAAVCHMRDWILGTKPGQIVSMGVYSDDSSGYGVPKDLIYSFPVTCSNGKWNIVHGLPLSEFSKNLMKITADELMDEKKEAFSFLEGN